MGSGPATHITRAPEVARAVVSPVGVTVRVMAKRQCSSPITLCGSSLSGIAAVQQAFIFLDGPADVLRAATACHRWRELAMADSVWRAKFEHEGMVDKADTFENQMPLPAVAAAEGGGNSEGDGGGSEKE